MIPAFASTFAFYICSLKMNMDLGHGTVPFPSGNKAELHLVEPRLAPVSPSKICESGMPDCMRMNKLRDTCSPCNMSEFVLYGTHIEAAWVATIAAGRHKERGLGIGPQWVHADPCLKVWDRAYQAEPAHARLFGER